jgi:glutathione S-transferase
MATLASTQITGANIVTDIILHHYDTSPFAELIRKALGLKGLSWHSVIIPTMMPKPDLVVLTGGYARTPVMQIGADIYCDSAAILDALEARFPNPTFYPAPLGPLHRMIAGWAGAAQFAAHVGAAMRNVPAGVLQPGFAEDRKKRFVGFDFDAMPRFAPHLETQCLAATQWIEATLADGRPFIGGDEAGHGDLALYANSWFLKVMPFAAEFASKAFAYPHFAAWYDRMAAFGQGNRIESDAATAIAAAKAAEPMPITRGVEAGFTEGQTVLIQTEQSGDEAVAGALLRSGPDGIVIQRETAEAGKLNIHFPRIGQIVRPA